MQTIELQNTNMDIKLFDNLIMMIKNFIEKYKLSDIDKKVDAIIIDFSPLQEKNFLISEEQEINQYDNFLEYLEQLEEYLENIEDLALTTNIAQKVDKALDIITLIQFRISGAISDYRLEHQCK
ncbi:MAG: hypothetical protein Q9M36_08040 [Sulfurovum sp.]|nr:hypothetical protein [Sulfurovum sp.]